MDKGRAGGWMDGWMGTGGDGSEKFPCEGVRQGYM